MVGVHMADLVAKGSGELGLAIDHREQAPGDVDMAAGRRGEGVDHRAVDHMKAALTAAPGGGGHPIPDPGDIGRDRAVIDPALFLDRRSVRLGHRRVLKRALSLGWYSRGQQDTRRQGEGGQGVAGALHHVAALRPLNLAGGLNRLGGDPLVQIIAHMALNVRQVFRPEV